MKILIKSCFRYSIPIALLITFTAILYQRITGPTHPKRIHYFIAGQSFNAKLIRSHNSSYDAPIELKIPQTNTPLTITVFYKRYPTSDPWTPLEMLPKEEDSSVVMAKLPAQPPAGKLQYYIKIIDPNKKILTLANANEPILIRFKGAVSAWILIPHIVFMFLALMMASLSGVEALFRTQSIRTLSFITTGFLFFGGLVLGPIVQKQAFGIYWSGIPFGWDLTDNKLLFAFLLFMIAIAFNFKKSSYNRWTIIIASIGLIAMYSIPHSLMGSQYDYETKKVITGD